MPKKKQTQDNYYSLAQIKKMKAAYNIIIGERSNGKTYAILKEIISNYVSNGKQGAILRRFSEDFTGKRGADLFSALIDNEEVSRLTNDQWNSVYYYSSRWYLCKYVELESGKVERYTDETPLAYGFAISQQEHEKGAGYPNVTIVAFDEFITRGGYLRDEFILFMNTLSTIIRDRNDVTIYMLANTVNKYCPYFAEMGLRHIREMKQGDIDCYAIPREDGTELRIAVEYCKTNGKGKKSDFYFSFDNKKLRMITHGQWEIDIYPHCPYKFKTKEILFRYFIIFDDDALQCEIVNHEGVLFTYIHRKTTPIKNPDTDLIYSKAYDARINWRRKLTIPQLEVEKRIAQFYKSDKVFYQDNEVGEIVHNYLLWCNGSD